MTSAPPPLLSLHGLSLDLGGRPVLRQLNASWPGGIGWVCGDEGTGKTSLLRLLAGQLQPDAGLVRWQNQALAPQNLAWFDPLEPSRDQRIVRELLEELGQPQALPARVEGLGLGPHLDKPLYQLSTGSRRKVFLAAALSLERPLTLLDQPFMALDRPSIGYLCLQFAQWVGQNDRLLLIADHLPPEGLPLTATLDLSASA